VVGQDRAVGVVVGWQTVVHKQGMSKAGIMVTTTRGGGGQVGCSYLVGATRKGVPPHLARSTRIQRSFIFNQGSLCCLQCCVMTYGGNGKRSEHSRGMRLDHTHVGLKPAIVGSNYILEWKILSQNEEHLTSSSCTTASSPWNPFGGGGLREPAPPAPARFPL
jgi:hypothetical protein